MLQFAFKVFNSILWENVCVYYGSVIIEFNITEVPFKHVFIDPCGLYH